MRVSKERRWTSGSRLRGTALLILVGIGVVVQLWLLAASVDALMRHQGSTAVHATFGSAIVFAINGLLILYVCNFDRKIKQE